MDDGIDNGPERGGAPADCAGGSRKKKVSIQRCVDDGDKTAYLRRIARLHATGDGGAPELMEIKQDFYAPVELWRKLHRYQRSGVRWLLELYKEAVGGILGDEMGLGKTAQVIAFLNCLSVSQRPVIGFSFSGLGPVLLLCPATLLFHWVQQFHLWWPRARVAVLHESGSFNGNYKKLINTIATSKDAVLVTSYGMMIRLIDKLLMCSWHVVVLDEGHLIRNPDAKWTVSVKQLRTPYRYIVTGSPMQNSLRELWSLFDFVYPGLLSDMTTFLCEVGMPITQGGYANASPLQVKTAYRCARLLRDKISPYMLRRLKSEVNSDVNLPLKSDHVLFCQLSKEQKELYMEYIQSDECSRILRGDAQLFVGLMHLRKLCNHADLVTKRYIRGAAGDEESSYGYWRRSGKMVVLDSVLKLWYQQKRRVVVFSQSRQMLDILEKFFKSQRYTFVRLDGSTAVSQRQSIVRTFNADKSVFLMMATTRVGGLGLDMTGADRVVLFDPDWNPTTDIQAQERAWRLGQTSDVLVFRLLSSGSVEEKIYHRQIFKQVLINRVLKNPRQRTFFKGLKVADLFSFIDTESVETHTLFRDAESVKEDLLKQVTAKKPEPVDTRLDVKLSPEKVERLKALARRMSKSMTLKKRRNNPSDGIQVSMLKKQAVVESEEQNSVNASSSSDDYILKNLLRVDSVLSHDLIIDATAISEDDPIEMEADRIARQAIRTLKKNEQRVRERTNGANNLKSGVSLCPPPSKVAVVEEDANPFFHSGKDKANPQSYTGSSLLQLIRQRQVLAKAASDSDNDEDQAESSSSRVRPMDTAPDKFQPIPCRFAYLADQIRLFMLECGGRTSTARIVERFQAQVPASDAAIFRSILYQTCSFRRSQDGNGLWIVKKKLLEN